MNHRRLMWLGACVATIFGLWLLATPSTRATPPNPPIIQLTDSHAIDVRPAWSPDNRSIAFQSNRDSSTFHIYVMNADGSNQRAVTKGPSDDRHPIWMPDGKSILFDSSNGGAREIWQVNVADGSLKQITHLGNEANFVSVSRDGKHIAFYVYKNNTLDLWVANIDGSQPKQLTTNLASASNNQCTFACHASAWSPDNQTLAYSAGELDDIWMINADGGNAHQVIADGEDNHFPWFLPDGRLGYITEHVSPIQSWTDAWVYDLRTQQKTMLQPQMSAQGPFEWNSDDTKVLFHSPRTGTFEIFLIDLSVPGGVDALRGTPVPTAVANTKAITNPSSAPAPAVPTPSNVMPLLLGAGALAVIAIGAVMGFIVWRRKPPSPDGATKTRR